MDKTVQDLQNELFRLSANLNRVGISPHEITNAAEGLYISIPLCSERQALEVQHTGDPLLGWSLTVYTWDRTGGVSGEELISYVVSYNDNYLFSVVSLTLTMIETQIKKREANFREFSKES